MNNWEDYFSVQIFFIILRETIESAIIVSVLLSFVNQNFTIPKQQQQDERSTNGSFNEEDVQLRSETSGNSITESQNLTKGKQIVPVEVFKRMKFQVWLGALLGLAICFVIGGSFIFLFYIIGTDLWSYTERIWEGIFSVLSSTIIAIMGMALLRINSMKTKWRAKLLKSFNNHYAHGLHHGEGTTATDANAELVELAQEEEQISLKRQKPNWKEKYFLGLLPFITTLREGLEAVVFVGGIGVNQPVSSFPLAIVLAMIIGGSTGYILYRGGNKMSLQYFLIFSTCFLYLVAAGLMSRGIWFFELEQFVQRCGQDTSETGSGPGSYDISNTIWHVNCCNGLKDGGWMLLNALFGWSNTATYGSVTSYILFWLGIILLINIRETFERKGIVSWIPLKWQISKIKKRIQLDKILIQEVLEANEIERGITHEVSSLSATTPLLASASS
ncbi:Fth1 protein [Martiniozyma asiatica (nom. inval.)]|nr:Fth1 protein [Martiniozyma asiatica]